MCDPFTAIAVASVVGATAATVGTVASIDQGNRQLSAQKRAAAEQKANSDRAFAEQDRANNAANMKQPDINALIASAARGGRAGNSSTFLNGAAGVNPKNLALGRASLLGG